MQKLLLLFGALVLSCTSVSLSQSTPSSWSQLSGLKAGQAIQVIDAASKKHTGTFVSASDTAMTIQETSSEQSIQRQDVRSVKVMQSKSSHRARNTLLFGAIGTGVGAGIGAAVAGNGGCLGCRKSKGAGIGAGVGAIVGLLVGAVMPAHGSTTVYKATH